ncbi:ADP-ribosylation factor-binding protein GGA1 [Liparis tanakae]|uniref:ADP-ribosylation factor-binding protein GGA1 n=1 Tax=Liparis tanakae TaxID=230148 RepID=A0A4Z2GXJ4_9TELE|nr:ADP-ribosylation factor-binding protein GGA1 [Liparis tanakae]
MAAAPPDEATLQSRINEATNPLNKETDWDTIKGFCDQINNEPEGPQLATRLLAHKIQSPQEWEAMQALMVLETCMKNCGKRFHSEVGKFRFLNELIKVVSPKYLGARAPETVKKKVLEIVYSWTVRMPDETKIVDAYRMLKKQGIVKLDPELPDDKPLPPPPPRASDILFEDEEKSKMLSRLLTSTHQEDLRAANKLIKEMVQEDQKRVEKVSKRLNAIQEVKESVGLLSQMLQGYSKDGCSESNQDLLKVRHLQMQLQSSSSADATDCRCGVDALHMSVPQDLYQRCEKMRPTLFRLASDTEDSDDALADILQANDNLTQVINQYRQLVKGEDVSTEGITLPSQPGSSSSALVDLMGLNASANAAPSSLQTLTQNMGISLLDDELMSLGLNVTENFDSRNNFQSSDGSDSFAACVPAAVLQPAVVQAPPAAAAGGGAAAPPQPMEELDMLGKTLIQQSLPPQSQQVKWDKLQPRSRVTLRDLQTKSNSSPRPAPTGTTTSSSSPSSSSFAAPPPLQSEQPDALSLAAADPYEHISLSDVTVPLEAIKPSSLLPVTVFDKHSLRVLFTFARDCPPSRPDVLVVIISMLSSAPSPVTSIRFQAAVPKEKVRLRYKLTFNLGDGCHDESGDVDQFPPPHTWGHL